MEPQPQATRKSKEPEMSGGAVLFLIFLLLILCNILEIWVPEYLATGISALVVMLVGFRFKKPMYRNNFAKWCLQSILVAVSFGLGLFIVNYYFP